MYFYSEYVCGYLPRRHIPLPLGSCLTHFTSYAQNTWLVLQGRVYYRFGIFRIVDLSKGSRHERKVQFF